MSDELEKLHAFYREGDNQFKVAGGIEGIRRLADDFYTMMENLPEAKTILKMHPEDLELSREKLALFLCGYLNGPDLYLEKFGEIKLAPAHAHLDIGPEERDAWLLCMRKALDKQDYPAPFKAFILNRLTIPAERCRTR
jgi:hemoglobin